MKSGSMAVVWSGEKMPRNGDQFYPFRQQSDFFYLSGINQEESVLLLFPEHRNSSLREVLFVRKPTSKSNLWTGPSLRPEEARTLSGISEVKWLEDLDATLDMMLPTATTIYSDQQYRLGGTYKVATLNPLVTTLRMVKEYEEVEEIKKASSITLSAFMNVLQMVKPGVMEYQVEAELIGEFIRLGAEGHAYEPIVASGKNALILHYVQNNSQCQDGELILLDFGAEVNNYAADCSRTIPVNGRFTKRQREVYEAVVRVFNQARALMKPGILMADFHTAVGKIWEKEHIGLGLYSLEEARSQSESDPLWRQYFMHGTSHSLGLDVHDPFDRSKPFQAGMVLTCEPAIYIPEEEIGIRLENDILITESEPADLLNEIPMEANEIEAFMHTTQ